MVEYQFQGVTNQQNNLSQNQLTTSTSFAQKASIIDVWQGPKHVPDLEC